MLQPVETMPVNLTEVKVSSMYFLDSHDEWNNIHFEDLWVYNKLFLSRTLGYTCGPCGVPVPKSDFYIVRPSFNILGMGRFSRIEYIERETDSYHPSDFWCEVFSGDHLSVDFYKKKSELVVKGYRSPENPLYKWDKWEKLNISVEYPEILNKLKGDYEWINCEFIGNKLIEVHFRRNPDFRYGNNVAIPVWYDDNVLNSSNYSYISDSDYLRRGFLIDYWDSNPKKSSD
jgi:hypothetical protein